MLRNSVPQSLQQEDPELQKLVDVIDAGLETTKNRLGLDVYFDIAFMPDEYVDLWLRAFGWNYKWTSPEEKRLLLKILPILVKENGTNTAIEIISKSFGGAKENPKIFEPIVYSPPISSGNTPSTDYSVFPDDWYYNPLTLDIELPHGVKPNLKAILNEMKAVWVRYRYTVKFKEIFKSRGPINALTGRTLHIGIASTNKTLSLSYDSELSGPILIRRVSRSVSIEQIAKDHLSSQWSDDIDFYGRNRWNSKLFEEDDSFRYPGKNTTIVPSISGMLSTDGVIGDWSENEAKPELFPTLDFTSRTRLARNRVVGKADIQALIDYATNLGLNVIDESNYLIVPSFNGALSSEGELAIGSLGDAVVCLIDGDLDLWKSIPVLHTRKTWQQLIKSFSSNEVFAKPKFSQAFNLSHKTKRSTEFISGLKMLRTTSMSIDIENLIIRAHSTKQVSTAKQTLDFEGLVQHLTEKGFDITTPYNEAISFSDTGELSGKAELLGRDEDNLNVTLLNGSVSDWENVYTKQVKKTKASKDQQKISALNSVVMNGVGLTVSQKTSLSNELSGQLQVRSSSRTVYIGQLARDYLASAWTKDYDFYGRNRWNSKTYIESVHDQYDGIKKPIETSQSGLLSTNSTLGINDSENQKPLTPLLDYTSPIRFVGNDVSTKNDVQGLIDLANSLNLTVVAETDNLFLLSDGYLSDDTFLATGNIEDAVICLVRGDLDVWLSIRTSSTRKTWQINHQMMTNNETATISATKSIAISNRSTVNKDFISGECIKQSVVITKQGNPSHVKNQRSSWWSPAATFVGSGFEEKLDAQIASVRQFY